MLDMLMHTNAIFHFILAHECTHVFLTLFGVQCLLHCNAQDVLQNHKGNNQGKVEPK